MIRIYLFFLLFLFITNCSIDTKTGIWENKNYLNNEKKISDLNFDHDLSFEEFKNNIILYGKLSKYPKLMDKK